MKLVIIISIVSVVWWSFMLWRIVEEISYLKQQNELLKELSICPAIINR